MISHLLIALAAGVASALMFASIVSGVMISVLLFYLAPLPLMVVALGWSPLHAAVGGIAAGAGLGILLGFPYLGAFVLTIALPAWWLGHLAMLGRPLGAMPATGAAPSAPTIEWYPSGRLLLWIAAFASLTTIAALLTLGADSAAITEALRRGLMRMTGLRAAAPSAASDTSMMIEALLTIAPAAAAVAAIMTLTLNLWLAGRITATSGRLRRPWPDLTSTALPPMTLVMLALALAFSFVGGLAAIIAQIISATLLMAVALTGLATLHALTLGRRHRLLWLISTYAVIAVFGWPIIGLIVLGLADAMFAVRHRAGLSRPPPPLA